MIKKSNVNDLVRIVGRSYMPLKDRPVYLVLKKKEDDYKYDFLLLSENGESFWTRFVRKSKDGNLVIIS
jgi:hypothetical protein